MKNAINQMECPIAAHSHDFLSLTNAGQLWLGLESIFLLTNKEPVQLRIHLEDWDGNRTAIVVNEFKISNEQHGYRIFYKNFKV